MSECDRTLNRLIAYFRDCLVADAGERRLNDVFAEQERELCLFECHWPQATQPGEVAVPPDQAARMHAILQLQPQERALLVGTCLVVGPGAAQAPPDAQEDSPGRSVQRRQAGVRAPLFLFDAELVRSDEQSVVRVYGDSIRINPTALEALGLEDEFAQLFEPDAAMVARLGERLAALPTLTYSPHPADYPGWRAGQSLRHAPVGIAWISTRSGMASSVAYELDQLGSMAMDALSPALQQILGQRPIGPARASNAAPDALPTTLTLAQAHTLHNAASEPLSVINGPPGTGKTHTLVCQAIDRVTQGESVLIVCANEQAADVVRTQLARLLDSAQGLIVRAGRGNHRQQLLARLDSLLSGEVSEGVRPAQPAAVLRRLRQASARTRRRESGFRKALGQAARDGGVWRRAGRDPLSVLKRWWLARKARKAPLLSEQWAQLTAEVQLHQSLARDYLHALARANRDQVLMQQRPQLAALATALRSRSSGRREARMDSLDWSALTKVFPIWVVSAAVLHRVLPLQCALFDLVIVDEATQCNLPLALPALQRGARAVVVGDPRQLRHFSFLARSRQQALAQRHQVSDAGLDLDYRERSLIDYALSSVAHGDAVVWLDEHFRSHPELIAFSNERFYAQRLKILTRSRQPGRPIEWRDCPVRVDGTVNLGEVDAVLHALQGLLDEYAGLPEQECPSIGVLAFFRATAERLESGLLARFALSSLSRHSVRVGTPYGFQGEERDIMLLATGVYPGRAAAALRYLNRADVFNVAITRARHRQLIFLPEGVRDQLGGSLLGDYLHHDGTQSAIAHPSAMPPEPVRVELLARLQALGARCRVDHPFAGQRLDLLVMLQDRALAIDIVGCDGAVGANWEWARYRQLERAGLLVFPIAQVAWDVRREHVWNTLLAHLGAESSGAGDDLDARMFRLRWRLENLPDPGLLNLLDQLALARRQVLHWLAQRFRPDELTYLRYRDSADALSQAAIAELAGAANLQEADILFQSEAADAAAEPPQGHALQTRLTAVQQAVAALHLLGRELATLETSRTQLDEALAEVLRLTERVQHYRGS